MGAAIIVIVLLVCMAVCLIRASRPSSYWEIDSAIWIMLAFLALLAALLIGVCKALAMRGWF